MDAQKTGNGEGKSLADIVDEYFYTADTISIYEYIKIQIESAIIIKALERTEGNQLAAAKMLGVHRNTLSHKMKKLNIDAGRFKK